MHTAQGTRDDKYQARGKEKSGARRKVIGNRIHFEMRNDNQPI
jgi:hypothetical protein